MGGSSDDVEIVVSNLEVATQSAKSSQDENADVHKAANAESDIISNVSFTRKMVVTVLSGCLMSLWSPLTTLAVSAEVKGVGVPLTSYAEYVCFCLAILLS